MVNPNPEKIKMMKILLEWWYFDEKGDRHLREDAPPEIVKLNAEYEKLYVH